MPRAKRGFKARRRRNKIMKAASGFVGARTVALMSEKVDPAWSAPRGPRATWLQGAPLAALGVETVLSALE